MRLSFKSLHKRFIRPTLSNHAFIYVKLTRVGYKVTTYPLSFAEFRSFIVCLRIHYIRRESFMVIRYIDVVHRTL